MSAIGSVHDGCDREMAFLRNEWREANRKLEELQKNYKPQAESMKNVFPVSLRQELKMKAGDKFSLYSEALDFEFHPSEVILMFEDAMRLRFSGGDSSGLEWAWHPFRIQADYAGEGGRLRMRTVEFPVKHELVRKGEAMRLRFDVLTDFTGPFLVTIMGFKAESLTT